MSPEKVLLLLSGFIRRISAIAGCPIVLRTWLQTSNVSRPSGRPSELSLALLGFCPVLTGLPALISKGPGCGKDWRLGIDGKMVRPDNIDDQRPDRSRDPEQSKDQNDRNHENTRDWLGTKIQDDPDPPET
ncbi:unnamed protein product [Caenorhabditis brenneri]